MVEVRAGTAAVQGVTWVLTLFFPSVLQVTAASLCLCGAVVFGAAVLGVPAISVVDFRGMEASDLF